jgi:hypothetical protein
MLQTGTHREMFMKNHKLLNNKEYVELCVNYIEKELIRIIDKKLIEQHQTEEALMLKQNGLGRSSQFVLKNKKLADKINFEHEIQVRAYDNRNSKNPKLKDMLIKNKRIDSTKSLTKKPSPFRSNKNSPT